MNADSDDVSVLLGAGGGDFAGERRYRAGTAPVALVAVDLDGDGSTDLATANLLSNDVSVLLNSGTGEFRAAVSAPAGSGPRAIVARDFNGDGTVDLATANSLSLDVSLLPGAGDGTFGPESRTFVGGVRLTAMTADDFNVDGRADLVVLDIGEASGAGTLLLGNGDGTFAPQPPFVVLRSPQSLTSGDFDADGLPDLAVPDFFFDRVAVLRNQGGATFVFLAGFDTIPGPASVAAGDFNRDAVPDLAVAGNGGLSILAGGPGGTFGPHAPLPAGTFLRGVVLADFDGDGLADLAAAGQLTNVVQTVRNRGGGAFGPFRVVPSGDGPRAVAAADLDEDGRLDLLLANEGSHDVAVLLGSGDGTFEEAARFFAGSGPTDLLVRDFDADGRVDLAVLAAGVDEVAVFLGRGGAVFEAAGSFRAASASFHMDAGDLDGDGILDLAVAGDGGAAVLRGFGDGRFGPPSLHAAGDLAYDVAIADLTGDGLPDLAVTLPFAGQVATLTNLGGGGGFALGGTFAFGAFPWSVAAADLDDDGRMDLAVSNSGSDDVSILLNDGNGNFPADVRLPAGGNPRGIAAGDFDGDGRPDVAVANSLSGDVSVFLGAGGGMFAPERRYRAGQGAEALAAADLDGSGFADLAVACFDSGDAWILLNETSRAGNRPPVAAAGPDLQAECASPAGAVVVLDGSASTDPDSTPGTNDDIASYDWFEDFGLPSQTALGSGVIVAATLPLGRHAVTLVVTDRAGASVADEAVIEVLDTTPPALSVAVSPALLWPPNHRLVEVAAAVTAADACGSPAIVLVSVTSSETDDAPGSGDGSTVDDIQGVEAGTADFQFLLRAGRGDGLGGRTYTATYVATDAAGNTATASAEVLVPENQSGETDPLAIAILESAAGTRVAWEGVAGALHYNVARGDAGRLRAAGGSIRLGPLVCLAAATRRADTAGSEDRSVPESGRAFFYVVEYDDGRPSTFSTESAALPRLGEDGCP